MRSKLFLCPLIAILLLASSASAVPAQVEIPLPSSKSKTGRLAVKEWIAPGWKMISSSTGDLNQDGNADWVLVLEEENPANRKPNEVLGPRVLNLNPRRLVVLLQTASGFHQVLTADRFIPSENDEDSPCLADPLLEYGGIQVLKGVLKIELGYWLSCGTYHVSHTTFAFRYENNRFRLIGLDGSEFMRSGGEGSEYSTNYLTGMQKITTGLNEFEESMPHTLWKKIPTGRKFYLDELDSSCDPSDEEGWCQ